LRLTPSGAKWPAGAAHCARHLNASLTPILTIADSTFTPRLDGLRAQIPLAVSAEL
jgi:hypothetical protein